MAKNIEHPIATGIKRYLKQEKIKATYKFITEYLNGYGIKAREEDDVYYLCNRKLVEKLDIINQFKEDEKELEKEGNLVLYLVNIVFGLLPIYTLLRKTPSEIIAKYDI